ncbi:hypothetical protein HW932_18700 [Allochromatium humboldtianum]|uniref:Uncharacterized protein n=1 Tax=Allochromatium humboldtianum TaxID=504901 RepID=A0A850RBC0_9GAMM|nr:hypothetical protein [Allochromatium humboldtianum]NVZ11284.1 hypothetical protein [Allochromatium humboldtianum]
MRTDNPESSTTSHEVDLNLISRQLKLISVLLSAIVLFCYLILIALV